MSCPRRVVAIAAVIAALAAGGAGRAQAGDPHRVWRTIESQHFVIHYYEPLGDVAHRLAVVAERAHRSLSPALGHAPDRKTIIVLTDDTDGANGFASVLPRNQINLFATAPNADSVLNDNDDWLYDLVSHEYSHILHLDTIGGLASLYNHVFGKTWAPNQVLPRWIIEGIAVYEESRRSAAGRIRSTQFDMYLRVPVLQGQELGLDQVSNNPIRFPRGNAAYLYGSHFLEYVFDRYGDDTLRRMSHANGSSTIPFGINRQLADVTGTSFDALYDDWRAHLRAKATLQLEAVERRGVRAGRQLTFHGEAARNPRYGRDGRELYWLDSDGISDAAVRALPVGGPLGAQRDVHFIERIGGFDVDGDGGLLYEQNWTFRDVYSFQDLFHWDRQSGRVDRLSRGERAREPALAPDGNRFAFTRNGGSRSEVVIGDLRTPGWRRVVWSGPGRFDQAFNPAWSPDGTRVAFVGWRAGGLRDILIAPVDGGPAVEVTHDRALDGDPVWSPDGRTLYFTSDRTGIANAYAHDLDSGETWQVTNVIGGVSELAVSPDGTRLAYTDFTGNGTDLFELTVDRRTWLPARPYVDDRPPATVVPDDEVAVSAPRPYRPLETLAPQAWTAALVLGTYGRAVQVETNGSDVAGLHAYDLGATVDLGRGDVNVGASYGYGGLRPGLRLAASRQIAQRTSIRLDGEPVPWSEEVLSATAGVGIPVRHNDESSLSLSFDYDLDWIRRTEAPPLTADPDQPLPSVPLANYVSAGLALRGAYSHVRGVLYGVGPTHGAEASASLRIDHPAIGATYRALTVSWFARGYYKLPWGVTPVLALRVVGGLRVSSLARGAAFALGGQPTQDVVQSIIDSSRASPTGFLRGYPPRVVAGNTYHLANLEYRQQLAEIERGPSTLPLYLKRVHLGLLVDAGMAYDDTITADRLRVSVGAAIRLDTLIGFYVPGAFELGYAHGLWSDGIGEAWFHLTSTL
ncbi:MAG TPA: LpqB family beta-propeller domain-containing protein [Kofleriaceae bacterium]|nr:LpqB family beta-propeller domain-containing protein [Kofleriaceae bacterium]